LGALSFLQINKKALTNVVRVYKVPQRGDKETTR